MTRMGDNITLNMPGNITFKYDSAELDPSFYRVLNSVPPATRVHFFSVLRGSWVCFLGTKRVGSVAT